MTIQNQTTFQTENKLIYAGVLKRMGANLIDKLIYLLLGILIFIVKMVMFRGLMIFNLNNSSFEVNISVLAIFLWLILIIIYRVFFETSKKRATWGMQAMNIQIVSNHAGTITKKKSLIRFLLYSLMSMSALYKIILMFEIIHRIKKQGLHDLLTKTYIIQKN